MNNNGSVGITTMTILTSVILVGATTSSVIFEGSDELAIEAEQTLNDVLDEITTYLKIDDCIGKYYSTNGTRRVEKIVILIKQLIQNSIDLSELTIKITNNNNVILLSYSGFADKINSKSIFEQPIWEKTNNAFSLIVIIDKDRSLLDYNIMNKDTAFITIKLPDEFAINGGESLTMSIIPAKGVTRSLILETPSFHSSDIISFIKI